MANNEITKELLETVIQSIKEEIFLIGDDYKIIWANKAALDHYGYKLEEAAGRHCYEITHHRTAVCQPPFDICPIASVSATGKPETVEHVHFTRENEKVFSEITVYPVVYGEKFLKSKGYLHIHITRDITDRKLKEEELLQRLKEIEIFNQAAVGREMKMIDLKKEVNALLEEQGRTPKYET